MQNDSRRAEMWAVMWGCVPSAAIQARANHNWESAKKATSICGKLLVQGAHYILGRRGPDTDLKRWGLKLAERGGKNAKKRAIVAVARKLAILLHRLWVTGEVYEPLRNGQAQLAAKKKAA